MVFKRLYNVLRSNINAGSASPAQEDFVSHDYTGSGSADRSYVEKEVVRDPVSQKELEYYSNLEVKPGAGLEEIKLSYKKLVKKYHPDKFHDNEEKRKFAEMVTSKLNEAYAYFEKKYVSR